MESMTAFACGGSANSVIDYNGCIITAVERKQCKLGVNIRSLHGLNWLPPGSWTHLNFKNKASAQNKIQ